jgi:hypothetical protein
MTSPEYLLVCIGCWTGIVIGTCVRDLVPDDRGINIIRGALVMMTVVAAGIWIMVLGAPPR